MRASHVLLALALATGAPATAQTSTTGKGAPAMKGIGTPTTRPSTASPAPGPAKGPSGAAPKAAAGADPAKGTAAAGRIAEPQPGVSAYLVQRSLLELVAVPGLRRLETPFEGKPLEAWLAGEQPVRIREVADDDGSGLPGQVDFWFRNARLLAVQTAAGTLSFRDGQLELAFDANGASLAEVADRDRRTLAQRFGSRAGQLLSAILDADLQRRGRLMRGAGLRCIGTEPDWGARTSGSTMRFDLPGFPPSTWKAEEPRPIPGELFRYSVRLFAGAEVVTPPPLPLDSPAGRADAPAPSPPRHGALLLHDTGVCTDRMSDRIYPFSALLVTPDGATFSGCCAESE